MTCSKHSKALSLPLHLLTADNSSFLFFFIFLSDWVQQHKDSNIPLHSNKITIPFVFKSCESHTAISNPFLLSKCLECKRKVRDLRIHLSLVENHENSATSGFLLSINQLLTAPIHFQNTPDHSTKPFTEEEYALLFPFTFSDFSSLFAGSFLDTTWRHWEDRNHKFLQSSSFYPFV
jgi:hypothetical protein